jgi:hypothetical protein
VSEIGIKRFESAYHLFFIDCGGDGKLLGKNAVWQVIVFSRLNKVNFFLHIAGSNPVGTANGKKLVVCLAFHHYSYNSLATVSLWIRYLNFCATHKVRQAMSAFNHEWPDQQTDQGSQ